MLKNEFFFVYFWFCYHGPGVYSQKSSLALAYIKSGLGIYLWRTEITDSSMENNEARCPKLSVFVGQKSVFRHYCIQNVKNVGI